MTGPETFLTGGLLLGFVAGFWQRLKGLALRAAGVLVLRARFEGEAAQAIAWLLWKKGKCRSFGERNYGSQTFFVQPTSRKQLVGFENVSEEPLFFWLGWVPALLCFSKVEAHSSSWSMSLTTARGLVNLDALVLEALDLLNKVRHEGDGASRYYVKRAAYSRLNGGSRDQAKNVSDTGSSGYAEVAEDVLRYDVRYLRWERSELGMSRGLHDPFDDLAFPPEVDVMVRAASRWLASEAWYKAKHIAWRMGWLLYGKPGTGKTSLVKAIGKKLDLPIVFFDLASYDNNAFVNAWAAMLGNAPCIALIEDVDGVFDGRKNRLQDGGDNSPHLTFDCLLNCISGVQEADGVLLVLTTNKVEDLDEALGKPSGDGTMSTRPGRIDYALELSTLRENERRRLAARILEDCPFEVERLVLEGDGDTGAQFQERCARVALAHYWNEGAGNEICAEEEACLPVTRARW